LKNILNDNKLLGFVCFPKVDKIFLLLLTREKILTEFYFVRLVILLCETRKLNDKVEKRVVYQQKASQSHNIVNTAIQYHKYVLLQKNMIINLYFLYRTKLWDTVFGTFEYRNHK